MGEIPTLEELIETTARATGIHPHIARAILTAVLPLVLKGPMEALAEWLDAEDTWDGDFADDNRILKARDRARSRDVRRAHLFTLSDTPGPRG